MPTNSAKNRLNKNANDPADETTGSVARIPVPQMVVTDLDGTIWDDSIKCHPATLDAFAQLAARQIPVLVATGRRGRSAEARLAENGLCLPSVLLNGALGIDFPIDHQFHSRSFTPVQTEAALQIFEHLDLAPCVYLADGRIAVGINPTSSDVHRSFLRDDFLEMEARQAAEQFDILSFSFFGQPKQVLETVVAEVFLATVESIDGEPRSCADHSLYDDPLYDHWTLTMQPPGISKREGIAAYLDYANLAPEQILAFGDGGNDLEMLDAADISFSMEDAFPDAKAAADIIIPSPTDGGWAQILNYLD